jgi:hypothetical protein
MINIKMYEEKWQIIIGEEIWQFENLEEFKKNLETIINIKDTYGRNKK